MSDKELIRTAFEHYQIVVIIPTYNNAATLANVINEVAEYTLNIIVVNDGSTDDTEQILLSFPEIEQLNYARNRGKGMALRQGFKKSLELGYSYAITIDSDGQHFAKDLPNFIDGLQKTKDAIIIGSRNMDQEGIPGKSSFGNWFSNFWFAVETGIRMPDTQSGYRLYPIYLMKSMHFFTRKYEFEIEVLVRCSWRGIKIASIPVSVYYAPPKERVSHFRPFRDFFRISILNTVLVLIAFLYIKPRNFLASLFVRETWEKFFKEQLLTTKEPAYITASSVALGICMGILPIWGFQLVTAIFLSILLKLNKFLVIIAANISIPPLIPLIIFLSYKTGTLWIKKNDNILIFSGNISLESIKNNFTQYFYGAITLAIIAGILSGLTTWLLLVLFRKKQVQ